MRRVLFTAFIAILFALGGESLRPARAAFQQTSVVHALYFYSIDCAHCLAVQKDTLEPLQAKYGAQLDLRSLEIGVPAYYELLIRAEQLFSIRPQDRGVPTLIVGDQMLIGEDAIRQRLPGLVESGLARGGVDFPKIPGLEATLSDPDPNATGGSIPLCLPGSLESNCNVSTPVWMAYFFQTGCQECSRAEADIKFVRSRFPQLIVDQFNVYDHTALAQWLAERAGRKDIHTPMLFIGTDALIGEEEITPQRLESLIAKYAQGGAERVWKDFDTANAQNTLIERFRALGPLTVVFAGLVDGLNPCAFATLIFLISYLSFSERKGREILAVGGAFTLSVFLAYLVVGLGFYKVLDLLGDLLTTLSRVVYALTALLCVLLALISFRDFLKARRGEIGEMSLKLPASLRRRVHAVVRSGQQVRAFVIGAFVTGVLVSLIELACTGQIYLPTIIFVASIPELRVQAISYLVLYNLVFILPLVVVFALTYFGTTSHELGRFLERHTATVKLGAVFLFAALAGWLGLSLRL